MSSELPKSPARSVALLTLERYRRHHFEDDRRQNRLLLVCLALAVLFFVRNDWLLLGHGTLFRTVLGVRSAYALATFCIAWLLGRVRRPAQMDRLLNVHHLALAVFLLVASWSRWRLGDGVGVLLTNSLLTVTVYFALRGPLAPRVALGSIVWVLTVAQCFSPYAQLSSVARTASIASVAALNVLGVWSVLSFEHQRRKRFEAEREERKLRAALAAKIEELAAENRRAEALARARSTFIATMSHEFRTPMNVVIGLSGVLLDSKLPEDSQSNVQAIRESAQALMGLLNDILDFTRIDAGKFLLRPGSFELRALVGSLETSLRPAAQAKGLALKCTVDPRIDPYFRADESRLRQVLVNLVSNAIKFTEQGAVYLELSIRGDSRQESTLEFTIRDTGPGIPTEARTKLFQPFEQLQQGTSRPHGGTGLGLVISQRLVEAMGGSITVGTPPDGARGTVFSFRLTLPKANAPTGNYLVPPEVDAAPERRLEVLVVDDNPLNRKVTLAILKKLGVQARAAGSGTEALAICTEHELDLVLMDLQMPGMSGIETTRELQKLHANRSMPRIVALSASVYDEDRRACRDAGMVDFLPKPVQIEELSRVLEQTRRGASSQPRRHNALPAKESAPH